MKQITWLSILRIIAWTKKKKTEKKVDGVVRRPDTSNALFLKQQEFRQLWSEALRERWGGGEGARGGRGDYAYARYLIWKTNTLFKWWSQSRYRDFAAKRNSWQEKFNGSVANTVRRNTCETANSARSNGQYLSRTEKHVLSRDNTYQVVNVD